MSGRWPAQLAASPGARPRPGRRDPGRAPREHGRAAQAAPGRRPARGRPVLGRVGDLRDHRSLRGAAGSGSSASYWQLNSVPASGSTTASGFTTYGPLVVSPNAFPGQLTVGTGHLGRPARHGRLHRQPPVRHLRQRGRDRGQQLLSGLTLTTNLPTVLADTGNDVAVARSLLGISALELLVLTVAALLAVARLLAGQREGETALLTARGATRWQLTRLTAAEVIPLSLVAALIGGGRRDLAGPAARQHPLSPAARPRAASACTPRAPGSTLSTPRSPSPRSRSARCSTRCFARAGAPPRSGAAGRPCCRCDEGRGRPGAGRAGGARVLAAAPVLGRLDVLERPVGHRPGAGARPGAGPGGRHGAHAAAAARRRPRRRPVVGGRPRAHLGAGGLAVQPPAAAPGRRRAAAGDGRRHRHAGARPAPELDQVRLRPGRLRDRRGRRVDLAAPLPAGATTTVSQAPGVRAAMAVSVNQVATPSQVVAIDAAQAPKVALLRADQSSLPPAALLRSITPAPCPAACPSAADRRRFTSPSR